MKKNVAMNVAVAAVAAGVGATAADAAISYTVPSSTVTENFNTLDSSGSTGVAWTNDLTLPGWSLNRQPTPGTAITTYNSNDGSSNTGNFISYGAAGNSDRALGGLASGGAYFGSPASGNVAGWISVAITNNTGGTLSEFTVSYDGEQWRQGGTSNATPSVAQTMTAQYGFGGTFQTVANWTNAGASFDFTSPVFGPSAASALDGNLPANRSAGLGGTVSNLTWAPSETLWIRWSENNDVNNDHGLAIDNFSIQAVPEPTSIAFIGLAGVAMVQRRRRWVA